VKDFGVGAIIEIGEPLAAAVHSLSPLAGGDVSLKVNHLTHVLNNLMRFSPEMSSRSVMPVVEPLISSPTK
jgi:hypothetical protein